METIIKTVVEQVEVPKKETAWHKFWQRLDGNKTIILGIVFSIIQACPINEPYKAIILGVLGLLGGKTLYDHINNGSLKRSVKGVVIE